MLAQRSTLGFKVKDRKTITAGMIINIEATNNDTWVTGKGPISPFIISSICPGRNNERMSAYMYNNIIATHNAASFNFTFIPTSSIAVVFVVASMLCSFLNDIDQFQSRT